jgi:hypothetical protein
MTDQWKDIISPEYDWGRFAKEIKEVTSEHPIPQGRLGTLMGMPIIADGFAKIDLTKIEHINEKDLGESDNRNKSCQS